MADQHPITPPPELVQQWMREAHDQPPGPDARLIAVLAARWGADQELEACCEWLEQNCGRWELPIELRSARRPEPPSLKEQSLKSLDKVVECLKMLVPGASVDGIHIETIRRALEQLND